MKNSNGIPRSRNGIRIQRNGRNRRWDNSRAVSRAEGTEGKEGAVVPGSIPRTDSRNAASSDQTDLD